MEVEHKWKFSLKLILKFKTGYPVKWIIDPFG
jgi:hypothetical protein